MQTELFHDKFQYRPSAQFAQNSACGIGKVRPFTVFASIMAGLKNCRSLTSTVLAKISKLLTQQTFPQLMNTITILSGFLKIKLFRTFLHLCF